MGGGNTGAPRGESGPPPGAAARSSGRDGVRAGRRASPRGNTTRKEAQAERTRALGRGMSDSVHEPAGHHR